MTHRDHVCGNKLCDIFGGERRRSEQPIHISQTCSRNRHRTYHGGTALRHTRRSRCLRHEVLAACQSSDL
jgi:hypothetical protein